MNYKFVTKKQKKFLEKAFDCLGINLDYFIEMVENYPVIKEENEEMKRILKQYEKNQGVITETINLISKNVTEHIQHHNDEMFGFTSSDEEDK